MHPRNIYKTPPNFDELRKLFPEFAEKVRVDVNGKSKLDFKDPEAVRVLTKCCLKKDFNLDIEIPKDKLLPTLPLRINYILWMEDLLDHCGIKDDIIGIDIGSGACCIYCLLAVRMNENWKMFALEIDHDNIRYAKDSVFRNRLDEKIVVIDQEGSPEIFKKLFEADNSKKTFTLCNPPFFSSKDQMLLGDNRTGKRKRLESSRQMSENSETVFNDGGELGFVTKILNESIELKDKIDIYSSMFGCKKNFEKFETELKKYDTINYTTTELIQGNIYRWAIAWSFTKKLSTFKTTKSHDKSEKPSNVLKHVIKSDKLEDVQKKLLDIFKDLKISVKPLKSEINKYYQYELETFENNWSNQRKKRRAEKRDEYIGQEGTSKLSGQSLRMGFEIYKIDSSIQIQIFFIDGSMTKDSVNQVLQYIKNDFNKSL